MLRRKNYRGWVISSFVWPVSGGGGGVISGVADTATIDLDITSLVLTANINNDSITNAMINSAAAIAYSKLNLSDSIVNADINSAAAIAYSKLNLTGSILNADINASAAIAYSKLNLSDSIVNADINSAAAIAYSKLNLASSIQDSDINGALTYSVLDLTDSIVNADINSAAAIAYSKLNLTGSIVNADINASAAIDGTKVDPDFGAQNIVTTGTVSASGATLSGLTDGFVKAASGVLSGGNTIDLTADVTGILPIANGGTGSSTQNFVDLTTDQSIAGLKTFTQDLAFTSNTAVLTTGTYNSADKTLTSFTSGSGDLQGISGASGQFIVLVNSTSADRTIINQSGSASAGDKIYTGTGTDFLWKQNSAVFLQEAEGDWYIIGGAGGGGTVNDTLNGTSLTTSSDPSQKVRYTGGSAQTLSALTFTDLPDGGKLIITGSSDTNTLTIPTSLSNVQMNGERVLYQHSTIEFVKDNTQLIEVSRNGI